MYNLMKELIDLYNKRKHPSVYDDKIIPTETEIRDIVSKAYPLVTSFRKMYGYTIHVLGPNKERSNHIWELCEGFKQWIDDTHHGEEARQTKSIGLSHIQTAPWILIYTPRVSPPNEYHAGETDHIDGKSVWDGLNWDYMNNQNRESGAVEIGMVAQMIMGGVLDKGYDTGFCVCLPRSGDKGLEKWKNYPFLDFYPTVIQTIGKAKKYQYQNKTPKQLKKDTRPPIDDIFNFVGSN